MGVESVRQKVAGRMWSARHRAWATHWIEARDAEREEAERLAASEASALNRSMAEAARDAADASRLQADAAAEANRLAREANDKANTANVIATVAAIIAVASAAITIISAFVK
jgi:hypothetical protein